MSVIEIFLLAFIGILFIVILTLHCDVHNLKIDFKGLRRSFIDLKIKVDEAKLIAQYEKLTNLTLHAIYDEVLIFRSEIGSYSEVQIDVADLEDQVELLTLKQCCKKGKKK